MSITPNRTITFTNTLSGEYFSFTAYGGFNIKQQVNIPGPYHLAIDNHLISNLLIKRKLHDSFLI
jgi:hypothetical protein